MSAKGPGTEGAMREVSASSSRHADADAAPQPGTLQGTATLVIQTRQAQRLLTGRAPREGKAYIVGLPRFSGLMRAIWLAARQDDPYADWYLLRVLEGIEATRAEFDRLQLPLQARLGGVQGIEIDLAQSTTPLRVPLRFATPYGYMGAYLIADYDHLVRLVLTAQHVALVSRATGEELMRRGARLIRRVFTTPLGWKPLAITREEARTNNPRIQQAREQMGEVPTDILAGTRRANIAPILRKPPPPKATW